MINGMRVHKIALLTFFLFLSAVCISAQDLGSSSGIFKTSKKPAKKAPAKKKSSPTKKTSSARRSTSGRRKTTPRETTTSPDRENSTSVPVKTGSNSKGPETSNEKSKTLTASKRKTENIVGTNRVIVYGGSSRVDSFSEKFENSIQAGNIARNQRDYVRAEKSYKKAAEIDPDDSRAIYGLGNLYSDQQRWEEAENSYRIAIALEPNSSAPYLAISYVLTQPVAGTNLGERYAEAEKMARTAISLSPENAIAYDQLGVALELRGIISNQTQNSYRKAIELEPEFALAYAHLGRILRRNGKTRESSEAYRQAVKMSNDVPTMILVADVMQSQQKYFESEQLLRRALREDPKNPTGLFLLGRALTTRKNFVEAETVLVKSVEVSPNSFVSYALLGSLYSRSGKLDKAEKTLKRALKVVSDNEKKRLAQEFEVVGDAFMDQKKKEDAIRVYRQAADLDPDNKSISTKLGEAGSV